MIEMMENYTSELEERVDRLTKKGAVDEEVKLVPDAIVINVESAQRRSTDEQADFTDRKMAVMMMAVPGFRG